MKTFRIEAQEVRSFGDFIEAANSGFIRHVNGLWNGNLDAFNDYLSWPEEEYQLELVGAEECSQNLGHEAQVTWLKSHLETCHPTNIPGLRERLARAEAGQGETLFDVIVEIIRSNRHVHLVLR